MKLGKIIFAFTYLLLISTISIAQITATDVYLPLYFTNASAASSRVPVAYRITLSGLTANSTYRCFNQLDSIGSSTNGSGNSIFPNYTGGNFTYGNPPNLTSLFSTFITSVGQTTFTGWYISEPTANGRQLPGGRAEVIKICLNDGLGGTSVVARPAPSNTMRALRIGTVTSDTSGTLLYGVSSETAKNFVLAFNNTAGTGRPLSATFIENDGVAVPASYLQVYRDSVEAKNGRFGLVIPNLNFQGVRRLEIRALSDGSLLRDYVSPDGVWPSSAETRNPTAGATGIRLGAVDLMTSIQVDASGLVISGGTKNFGSHAINTDTDVVFNIMNLSTGSSPLSFNTITGSSDFSYIGSNPTFIEGGQGTIVTFTVRFTPSSSGNKTAQLTFTNLDPFNSPYTINLSGSCPFTGGTVNNPNGDPQLPWNPVIPNDPSLNNTPPVQVTFPAQSGANQNPASITVSHTVSRPAGLTNVIITPNNTINRFWTLSTPTQLFTNATLVLRFTAADLPAGIPNPVTAVPPLSAVYSTDGGNNWINQAGVTSGPDGFGVYSFTISGLTHFSMWGLGNTGTLPVTLSSFRAYQVGSAIQLTWRTETEISNHHFLLDRWVVGDETNRREFYISSKASNGSSTTPINYSFKDTDHLVNGRTYVYQLSEVDFDGRSTVLRTVSVLTQAQTTLIPTGINLLVAYPNPFNPTASVRVQLQEPGIATIAVYNLNGQLVKQLYQGVVGTQTLVIPFDGTSLPSSVYFVRITSDNFSADKKLVLMR